jgi:two-component system response regulator NreC
MNKDINVLIADDHAIVRSGLRLLLSSEEDIHVVGEAADGGEVVDLVERLAPEVVLMDIGMPTINGVEATRILKERFPSVHVLILTVHRSEEYFFQTLEAGASGYILKAAETSELINAVRTVARGEVFLYPSMAKRLVQQYLRQTEEGQKGDILTDRERQILTLIAKGYTNREIADQLVISPSTVYSHRTNVMHKLNLGTRHELVRYARERGLI